MVHYALWRHWKSLRKQQKLEAFERFKGLLYKRTITRNLTILTPCRIQTLKLLLSVSFIKLKIQLLMTTNSAQALCYGILLHFQKLEVCGKNIKTNVQKNHTLLYVAKSIRCIPEKIQKKKKTWQGDGNIWNILGKEGKKYERQHLLNNTYMTDSLLGAFTCILTFTV